VIASNLRAEARTTAPVWTRRGATPSLGRVESNIICILCERYSPERSTAPIGEYNGNTDSLRVECPRCGIYNVSNEMFEASPGGLKESLGLLLSGLVRSDNDANKRPRTTITEDNWKELAESAQQPASYAVRVAWLLENLARRCMYPGRFTERMSLEPLAAMVYLPLAACAGVLQQMHDAGLIGIIESNPFAFKAALSSAGWIRVDELQAYSPRSDRAFVAMSFAKSMKPAYEHGIEPALAKAGYKRPFRVDEMEHLAGATKPDFEPKIDNRIMAEIRRATFLVVDVTGGRQAVYFEAGFAMGLGRPIIWTCQKAKFKKDMCFDTRQFGHIIWETHAGLQEELTAAIGAMGLDRTLRG
jgi:hypothetical protein